MYVMESPRKGQSTRRRENLVPSQYSTYRQVEKEHTRSPTLYFRINFDSAPVAFNNTSTEFQRPCFSVVGAVIIQRKERSEKLEAVELARRVGGAGANRILFRTKDICSRSTSHIRSGSKNTVVARG